MCNSVLLRPLAAVAGAALLAGGLSTAPASAATTTQIRPADFTAPTDTAGGATMQVLADGVYLKTPDGNSYARAHFKVGVPLADVHAVDYTWYGSDFKPGVYYDIDLDGDGKLDGQFLGESAYGGKDVWLNRDAEDYASTTVAAGFFADHAPCSGPNGLTAQNGNQDGCTSSGNPEAHGSLDDWTRSLKAAGKNPVIYSGGFLLNGAAGGGVLSSITYGPTTYTFTSTAPAAGTTTPTTGGTTTTAPAKRAVTVAATAQRGVVKAKRKIRLSGSATPVGPSAVATLEQLRGGAYVAIDKVAVTSSGTFAFKLKSARAKGKLFFRVVVAETTTTASATSAPIKVRIRPLGR